MACFLSFERFDFVVDISGLVDVEILVFGLGLLAKLEGTRINLPFLQLNHLGYDLGMRHVPVQVLQLRLGGFGVGRQASGDYFLDFGGPVTRKGFPLQPPFDGANIGQLFSPHDDSGRL